MLKGTSGGLSPTSSSGQGQHWLQSQLLSALSSWEVFTPRAEIAKPPWVTCSTACLASSWKFLPAPADHLGSPSLDLFQFFNIFIVLLAPKLDIALQMQYDECWVKGNCHFLWSVGPYSLLTGCRTLKIAKDVVSLNAARAHCWLMFSLLTTRTRGLFQQSWHPCFTSAVD